MSKTTLLINEPPLQLLPSLAKLIGLNEAIVTQQLHFYLSNPKCGVVRDGHRWIYNTYQQWQEECFCFWSIDTIKRTFLHLEELKVVVSCQPEGRESRRKYYRLNPAAVDRLTFEALAEQGKLPPSARTGQVAPNEQGKLPPSEQGKLPPSLSTENRRESAEKNPQPPSASAAPSLSGESSIKSKFPTSEAAKRIANLFGRRLTTAWSEKEIRAFKKLHPVSLDDLTLLEGYYAAERAKKRGIHRRDLQTFLNNYLGELDRARAWKDSGGTAPRKGQEPEPPTSAF